MGEAVRRRLVWLALAGALAFLALYATAWHLALSNPRNITNAANRLIESQAESMFELLGLYAANILTVMMAILGSIDALSGAIASGAMQTLAAKPIRRGQILLGKWIGFLVLLSVFQALLVGGVMAIAWVFAGVIPPHAGLGAALLWGEMVLLLTLTLLWGTRLATLANGVAGVIRYARVGVDDIALRRPTLDDAYLALTGRRAGDHADAEAAEREVALV